MKGEAGYETRDRMRTFTPATTGVWAKMSADEELGIVYMPSSCETGDYYGGHRRGNMKGPA